MKIALCYICVTQGAKTADYAARFVASYREHPPGYPHETIIICNGGPAKTDQAAMFSCLVGYVWPRINDPGWDISAYLDAARGPCSEFDAMLCLGESCYFHRAGWLRRFVDAWQKHGEGMYGSFSSNVVRGHLNTTGFLIGPKRLAEYPLKVAGKKDRYEFEHGKHSLWRRLSKQGRPVMLVTWDGEWQPQEWRSPPDILWRGDQSNCLLWCHHTDNFFDLNMRRQLNWSRSIDRPFQ